MKIFAAVIFLILLSIGIISLYKYFQLTSCITKTNPKIRCGLKYSAPDGKSNTYVAKIDKFKNNGLKAYVILNFGLKKVEFPIGEHDLDRILIKTESTGQNELSEADLTYVNKESAATLSNLYSGKYVQINLPTENAKTDRLAQIEKVNIDTSEFKRLAAREKDFWDRCTKELSRLEKLLIVNNVWGSLQQFYLSQVNSNNSQCTPVVSTLIII